MTKPRPVDWQRIRTAKEQELPALRGLALSEITPSRRDFTQFLGAGREEVAAIGTLRRRDPWSDESWPGLDVDRVARAFDDADVAALAVSTEPVAYNGRLDDLRAAADAVSAPILRDDYLVDALQVFHSRMHGADACVVPVAWVGPEALAEMVRTATSLHMATILAVLAPADVERVLPFERTLVGVWAQADSGEVDVDALRSIAAEIPLRRTVVLLGDVPEARQWQALHGLVDAALVARPLLQAADPAAALEALRHG